MIRDLIEASLPSLEEIPQTIDKTSINDLPLARWKGPTHLVQTDEEVATAVQDLADRRVLGFDTESRPSFRKGQNFAPALMQFAHDQAVYLFQLQQITDLQPVFDLLEDASILKVGVALHDDVKRLQQVKKFRARGFVDIAQTTQAMGIVNTGLRSLTAILLNHRISKGAQVTNWARKELTEPQIKYAATDAWISLCLYRRLESLGQVGQVGQVMKS